MMALTVNLLEPRRKKMKPVESSPLNEENVDAPEDLEVNIAVS